MSATLGDLNIGSMYAGSRKIAEAWLGNVKVYGGSSPSPSTVTIGGRAYPVVQIGNQLWTAENLDWKFDGIWFRDGVDGNEMDETETAQACYYEYDESTYGVTGNKYGLLYNWHAVNLLSNLSILPSGWHVPTSTEYEELITYLGYEVSGEKLKVEPPTWNGTNDYNFSGLPSSYWSWSGFVPLNGNAQFWTASANDETNSIAYTLSTFMSSLEFSSYLLSCACSIRLCCSAP